MGKYVDQLEKIIKHGYSVRSGIYSAIDSSISTKLDDYGQYEYVLPKHIDDKVAKQLLTVDSMSDLSYNEDYIAGMLYGNTKGIKKNQTVGYYQDLYIGYVKTGNYRNEGSSGGMTTWLLARLLEEGEIDGVVHVHALSPKENSGKLFKYVISRDIENVKKGAKSRYYPMELSEILHLIKKRPGRYAIVGIPEFIMELRLLCEFDQYFKESIVYMVGLVCGHQKSTKYAEALTWEHGVTPGKLEGIDFRAKRPEGFAWDYSTQFTFTKNNTKETLSKTSSELFSSNWGHGMFKVNFSDYTDNAFNEVADVVLGDAWLPRFETDSKGNNIVIVRNSKIAKIIKKGLSDGDLELQETDPYTIIDSQKGLVRHTKHELAYRLHRQRQRGIWHPKKRVKPSNRLGRHRAKIQDVREEIAVKSHSHYREAVRNKDFNYFREKMSPLLEEYKELYANSEATQKRRPLLRTNSSGKHLVFLKNKLQALTRIKGVFSAQEEGRLFFDLYRKLLLAGKNKKNMIYIFGAPYHGNLGDQAQTYCIEQWCRKRYPKHKVISIDTISAFKKEKYILRKIRSIIKPGDKLFLHSGYHTTDLWELENELNLAVLETFPDFHITVLPQTIHFEDGKKLELTASSYNRHGNVTFMCRDEQSYDIAKKHFTNIRLELMPDIVTTLIGDRKISQTVSRSRREGVLLCFRNDKESKYGREIENIKKQVSDISPNISQLDTTLDIDPYYFKKHRKQIIKNFLKDVKKHKLVITDRYHGTIFSVVSNTPVIVLGSTDHKLSSGVKWFEDRIFADRVYYAESPREAVALAHKIYGSFNFNKKLPSYFSEKYWDHIDLTEGPQNE